MNLFKWFKKKLIVSDYPEIKREGWSVKHYGENFFLKYSTGIIEEKGAVYVVNKKIYDKVKNSSITLEELFKKYDILSKFKKICSIGEERTGFVIPNTDTRYGNGDFIVADENGVYFIEYQCSGHGGGSRKFEINEQIYKEARTGKFSTSDLFKRYNLYRFDIPENNA